MPASRFDQQLPLDGDTLLSRIRHKVGKEPAPAERIAPADPPAAPPAPRPSRESMLGAQADFNAALLQSLDHLGAHVESQQQALAGFEERHGQQARQLADQLAQA